MSRLNFKIEKGHPLPEINFDFKLFPFEKMQIGDSFFVKNIDLFNYSTHDTKAYLRRQCNQFKRFTNSNFVFSVRSDRSAEKPTEQGCRVFRIY